MSPHTSQYFHINETSYLNFSIPLSKSTMHYNINTRQEVKTETQLKYVGAVTNILEKSFCSCKSFDKSLNLLEHLVKKCVKYYGCLETNLWNDIQHNETMNANELPFNDKYKDHFYCPSLEQCFIRTFLGDYFWYVK